MPLSGLERMMGVEPTYLDWKSNALPLNYTRIRGSFIHPTKLAINRMVLPVRILKRVENQELLFATWMREWGLNPRPSAHGADELPSALSRNMWRLRNTDRRN